MNILFAHDHVLRKIGDKYYSTGGLSQEVLTRYLEKEDKIKVYTRQICIGEKTTKLVEVSGNQIKCEPSNYYKNYTDYYFKKKLIKAEVKKVIENIDFCIIRLPSTLGGIVLKEAKKRNIAYMVELVTCPWDSLWNYGNIYGKILAPISFIKTRRQIKNAKNVVYVSNNFLQKRYPTRGKSICCSNVNIEKVNIDVLNKRINKIIQTKEIDEINIGLVGSLNVGYKGHDTAIKIAALMKDKYKIKIHFLGAGEKQRWIKMAKKFRVIDNIIFDNTLPSGEKVYNWMDQLDIFLIPSLQEGLPRALIEAMSRGCVAIGTHTGGIPELLQHDYICKKRDYKSMAKIIERLILNTKEMEKQANINFYNAQNYTKDILNNKRREFLQDIYKEENLL